MRPAFQTAACLTKQKANKSEANTERSNLKVNTERPLEIKSEYHTANFTTKIYDTWMFTNSTEVTLHYNIERRGQSLSNLFD